jgi:arylsulfatase A-like enzyme
MKNSIVARNHYANYPLSANALLSIFTSSYDHPGKELVIQNYPSVPLMTAPEILKDRGYRNCLIHTGSLLYAGQKKFLQGRKFDSILHYHDLKNTPPYNYQVGWGLDERSMIKPAIDFMKQNTGSPCFLTLMPVNPHHPYAIPSRTEEERRRFMITGPIPEELPHREKIRMDYFNSLHYADAALGELVEALEKEGLMDNTLLFVMADHGEAFYEHRGNYNHPFFLYEENVHVPMIIYNKKLIPSTVEIEAITRHIDILPTVLDLLDIPGRREQEGLSILSGRPEQMALLHTNWKDDFLGVRDGRWKYIRRMSDSREELYDLAGDPAERKNLSEERADITQRYRAYTDSARAYNVRFYREILRGVEVGGKGPSAFRTDEKTWEDYKEDAKNKKPDAIR